MKLTGKGMMKEIKFEYAKGEGVLTVSQTAMSRLVELDHGGTHNPQEESELAFLKKKIFKMDRVKRTIRTTREGNTVIFIEPNYKEIQA